MTVRIGIIGAGWSTRVQIPCFRMVGLEIAAICTRTPEKAARVAQDFGIPFHTADYRDLIANPDVDLVSIVSPPHLHAETAIAALQAGKHVLCEKPTAMHAREAEQMLRAAQAHPDRLALIDHELRFLPVRQQMRRLIADGTIGRVLHVEARWSNNSRLDPELPWNWWSDSETGGGTLGAIGSHALDALTWLIDAPVTRVSADLRTFVAERADASGTRRAVTSDDHSTLQLRFGDEVSGSAYFSEVTPLPRQHRVVVSGAEGALVLDGEQLQRFGPDQPNGEHLGDAEGIELPPGVLVGEFPRGTVEIGRALRRALDDGDAKALREAADFAQGLHIQRVLDAARESSVSGAWVAVL